MMAVTVAVKKEQALMEYISLYVLIIYVLISRTEHAEVSPSHHLNP